MQEADVALAQVPQADGKRKNRPILLLRELPGYQDFLVCGISTQLHQEVVGFDEIILSDASDFTASGLVTTSLIRLGFLAVIPCNRILGTIGSISEARHKRLLQTLSAYLIHTSLTISP